MDDEMKSSLPFNKNKTNTINSNPVEQTPHFGSSCSYVHSVRQTSILGALLTIMMLMLVMSYSDSDVDDAKELLMIVMMMIMAMVWHIVQLT